MSDKDLRQLRNAFGAFLTGVTVITSREAGGIPRGFTANSFTSVSLEPPMLLVCIDRVAESFDVFTRQPGFAVNILTEHQVETSGLFASKRADKFDITPWTESDTGNPVLDGVCAWFDCAREKVIDAGDHVILLGRVLSFDYNDGIGLGYVRGGYMSLGLERFAARTAGATADVVVGAVVEHAGKLLLFENPDTGELYVPASGLDGAPGSLGRLQADLEALDLGIHVSALFAVFEYEDTGQQAIYYRARAETGDGDERFHAFDEIPWERVRSKPHVIMLKRYIHEASKHRFGIYYGSDRDGSVAVSQDAP